jgi:anti-anti-sigma factor
MSRKAGAMSFLRLRSLHACEKTIVSTRGDIDLASAQLFEEHINKELGRGEMTLVVNLAHTGYIDSSGLAVLLRAHKNLQNCGGRLAVIGCQPTLTRVFNMVGFNNLFQIQERLPSRLRRYHN